MYMVENIAKFPQKYILKTESTVTHTISMHDRNKKTLQMFSQKLYAECFCNGKAIVR